MRAIAQNDYSVERRAGFRAIPFNKFIGYVTISRLGVRRSEAIQDAVLACSRSSRRSTDFVVRRLLEVGRCFMIDSLRAIDQSSLRFATSVSGLPVTRSERLARVRADRLRPRFAGRRALIRAKTFRWQSVTSVLDLGLPQDGDVR